MAKRTDVVVPPCPSCGKNTLEVITGTGYFLCRNIGCEMRRFLIKITASSRGVSAEFTPMTEADCYKLDRLLAKCNGHPSTITPPRCIERRHDFNKLPKRRGERQKA